MAFLGNIFTKKRKGTVECFGKLPFYRDFISVATTNEAVQWKNWLLNFAGKKYPPLPKGLWPFIFRSSSNSDMLVGLIEDSSDGIREFPFSIFCTASNRKSLFYSDTLRAIWENLKNVRENINEIDDINPLYSLLRGKVFTYEDGTSATDTVPFSEILSARNNTSRPLLLITNDLPEQHWHLLYDSQGTIDFFIKEWAKQAGN